MEEVKVLNFLQQIFKNNIKKYEISSLTKPGENYLSLMLKIDLNLNNDETLHAVAKCVKTGNDFVNELFPVAFKNEINFYKEILPVLKNFQKENGMEDVMDFFPEFYGARININGGNDVDTDAILVLENLKYKGYNNIDRHIGFDLDGAKLILKDLAILHASALALKLTKKEEFKKIKNQFKKAIPPPHPNDKTHYKRPLEVFFEILDEYEDCRLYIERLKEHFLKMREAIHDFFDKPAREPFATLIHCDLWINNTMQVKENGKIIKNKFVDFQLMYYQSPLADILFFIWSSIQLDIIKNNFENLLKYYHTEFIKSLKKFNCNTNFFTYDKFLDELDLAAPTNFMDIMYMTMFVVFGKKNLEEEERAGCNIVKEDVPKAAKDKIAYMVKMYGEKGWI